MGFPDVPWPRRLTWDPNPGHREGRRVQAPGLESLKPKLVGTAGDRMSSTSAGQKGIPSDPARTAMASPALNSTVLHVSFKEIKSLKN